MDMAPAQAAALWSGLLILLMVGLAIRVVGARRANRIVIGDGGNAQLILAGNAAEYIPAGIGALAVLTLLGMPAWPLHAVGGALFLGRLIHAAGLSEKKNTLARMVGMGLTLTALITAAGMLIVHAFVGGPH